MDYRKAIQGLIEETSNKKIVWSNIDPKSFACQRIIGEGNFFPKAYYCNYRKENHEFELFLVWEKTSFYNDDLDRNVDIYFPRLIIIQNSLFIGCLPMNEIENELIKTLAETIDCNNEVMHNFLKLF
jgi:hypothetical protein